MTAHDRAPAPPLGETDLQRIETLVGAATQAPWHPFVSPWPDKMHAVTATDEAGPPIAYVGNTLLGGPANDANLQFIAAARTDVPALVAALRAAWYARDTYEAALASAMTALDDAARDADRYKTALEGIERVARSGARGWSDWARIAEEARAALAAPGASGRATEEQGT